MTNASSFILLVVGIIILAYALGAFLLRVGGEDIASDDDGEQQ